jgi:hypothetical protein
MKVEQISIFIENKPGRLAEVTRVLASAEINIRALTVADTADFGVLRLIVDKCEEAIKVLRANKFTVQKTNVLAVEVPDNPGGLAGLLEKLDAKNINVEYMYAFVDHRNKDALIIFRFDNNDEAIKMLQSEGYKVLPGAKVYSL